MPCRRPEVRLGLHRPRWQIPDSERHRLRWPWRLKKQGSRCGCQKLSARPGHNFSRNVVLMPSDRDLYTGRRGRAALSRKGIFAENAAARDRF